MVASWTMDKQPQQSGLRGPVRNCTASGKPGTFAWAEGGGSPFFAVTASRDDNTRTLTRTSYRRLGSNLGEPLAI